MNQENPEDEDAKNKSHNRLSEFILLGQRLYCLLTQDSADLLNQQIPLFLDGLKECGLSHTLSAAEPLKDINIPKSAVPGKATSTAILQVRSWTEATKSALFFEASSRTLVQINPSGVLPELSQFQGFNESQEKLREETIVCIERGAFRAAIVMGWNLVYDYIRQWMFDNHLVQFNRSLLSGYLKKNGDPQFTEIKEYEDFFIGKPSEYVVIDTCEAANLWGAKLSRKLHYYLNRRNDFAHPSGLAPSREQANEYIKNLLDLLSERPFKTSNADTPDVE